MLIRSPFGRATSSGGVAGIFGIKALGGLGGVAFMNQPAGTALGILIGFGGGLLVYGALKAMVGIRLDAEDEFNGTDLTIHKISASAERETLW